MGWETCRHDWDRWIGIHEASFNVQLGCIRRCKTCGAREYNDWCSTRIGNEFKILPPGEMPGEPAPVPAKKRRRKS